MSIRSNGLIFYSVELLRLAAGSSKPYGFEISRNRASELVHLFDVLELDITIEIVRKLVKTRGDVCYLQDEGRVRGDGTREAAAVCVSFARLRILALVGSCPTWP